MTMSVENRKTFHVSFKNRQDKTQDMWFVAHSIEVEISEANTQFIRIDNSAVMLVDTWIRNYPTLTIVDKG